LWHLCRNGCTGERASTLPCVTPLAPAPAATAGDPIPSVSMDCLRAPAALLAFFPVVRSAAPLSLRG